MLAQLSTATCSGWGCYGNNSASSALTNLAPGPPPPPGPGGPPPPPAKATATAAPNMSVYKKWLADHPTKPVKTQTKSSASTS